MGILSAVAAQIETIPDLAGRVGIAVNVREVLAEQYAGPRAWIVEPRGSADRNGTIGAVIQDREQRIGVLVLASGEAGAAAADLLDAVEALRDEVQAKLLGYRPSGDFAPVEYVRDGLVKSADADIYWLSEYRTTHQLTSV